MRNFKDLVIWKQAMELAVKVYSLEEIFTALHAEQKQIHSLISKLG